MKIFSIVRFILFTLSLFIASPVLATPSEIIIIRHADKLIQEDPGPTLSPTGIIRSISFALYFTNKFPDPDFVFATNPIQNENKDSSIRELQTVAPLANILAQKHPDSGFPILHPYDSSNYKKLANDLLNSKKYNGKRILICWNHKKIPQLVAALGVNDSFNKWLSNDFDTVLVIKYSEHDEVEKFEILNQQYPVPTTFSWEKLNEAISK